MRARRAHKRSHDVLIYLPSVSTVIDGGGGPPSGGAEVQMPMLARGLARLGARVCMVAFDGGADIADGVDGIDIVRRPPYLARRGRSGKMREAHAIADSIADADAEVVVTRSAAPTTALVAAAAKLQRRRFVYSSASDADFDMAKVEHKRQNAALFHLGLRLADLLVVQNDRQRLLCEQRFRRASVVIESIAEPAPQRKLEPEAFLWAGRIHACKQPLHYIELARAVPEARFWMVGVPEPGADRQQLLRECRTAAREVPNLELLDPRPREQLMALVDRAIAIVNTSEFEGLSNVFLEGWARGVPALSLEHDPDGLIERCGLGEFAHGSAARMASLARDLWVRRTDQQAVADRCRRYVREHHAPNAVYSKWFQALRLVTSATHSAPNRTRAF